MRKKRSDVEYEERKRRRRNIPTNKTVLLNGNDATHVATMLGC